jgi:CDP-paratose 2-epimerase
VKLLITGVCGFVGSTLANCFTDRVPGIEIWGIDSLVRKGSETNVEPLKSRGVRVILGDVRDATSFDGVPRVDWVIDAAANPSVLAGVAGASGRSSPGDTVHEQILGAVNAIEFCRRHSAGIIFLSTSRTYSIGTLSALSLQVCGDGYQPVDAREDVSAAGVTEAFSTEAPLSIYGSAKRAVEILVAEYHATFGLPAWIDRCGVLAGAGQFGYDQQGIFSYWIHAFRRRDRLRYIGFGGHGYQVRDCLHPHDLAALVQLQMAAPPAAGDPITFNVSGGHESATSLRRLTAWCEERFGHHAVASDAADRPFDVPWLVLDSAAARRRWQWAPTRTAAAIFEEIALHAEQNPSWLELSRP